MNTQFFFLFLFFLFFWGDRVSLVQVGLEFIFPGAGMEDIKFLFL